MEGIITGGIGGYLGRPSAADNGYLGFDNVSIPLDAMLSKYICLDEDLNYTVNSGDLLKVMYGFMLYLRYNIAIDTGIGLAKSV